MGEAKKIQDRPYLSELGVFSREVARMRDEALHVRRVLLDEISLLEGEITGRRVRVAEQEEIVARCEAALQLPEERSGVAAARQRAIAENEAADLGAPDYEEPAADHHNSEEN